MRDVDQGLGRYCPPRYKMSFNSRYEGSICVSMTWLAVSAIPWDKGSEGEGGTKGGGAAAAWIQIWSLLQVYHSNAM